MTETRINRRHFIGAAAGLAGVAAYGPHGFAQALKLPTSPVALSVVDVAGNLALTQRAIENYRKAKPNLVSRITFTKAPAPELPSKLKAQQAANRVDIDLVLTGTDALAAGVEQKLWLPPCRSMPVHCRSSKRSSSKALGRCRVSPAGRASS